MIKIKKFKSLVLFVVLITMGCGPSANERPNSKKPSAKKEQIKVPKQEIKEPAQEIKEPKQQIKAPVQQKTESGELDKFGRSPGHPHYGHNHASGQHGKQIVDSLQKPASGKPDKFGRQPGHPHYGHNHK